MMEKLVLDRLIEIVELPGKKAEARAEGLAHGYQLLQREIEGLRERVAEAKKAELPFSDLARAAKAVLDARGPKAVRMARVKLRTALDEANEHIDWIPF